MVGNFFENLCHLLGDFRNFIDFQRFLGLSKICEAFLRFSTFVEILGFLKILLEFLLRFRGCLE